MGCCCSKSKSGKHGISAEDWDTDPLLSNAAENLAASETLESSSDGKLTRKELEKLQLLVQHASEKFLDISTLKALERSTGPEEVSQSYVLNMESLLSKVAAQAWISPEFKAQIVSIHERDVEWMADCDQGQGSCDFADNPISDLESSAQLVVSWTEGE